MMNWIWLGAVVAFGVLEAATAALVSIWFVGGAAVALRRWRLSLMTPISSSPIRRSL